MDSDDRRKADEAFRLRIIEQQAEIKAMLVASAEAQKSIQADIAKGTARMTEVEHVLWGGPGQDNIGLLERHRRLVRNAMWIGSVLMFVFSALGKAVSPIMNKFAEDYYMNSTAHRFMMEKKQTPTTSRTRRRKRVVEETPPAEETPAPAEETP